MLFVHSKHSLSTLVTKTCQQSHRQCNSVKFVTRKHMSPQGPIFVDNLVTLSTPFRKNLNNS